MAHPTDPRERWRVEDAEPAFSAEALGQMTETELHGYLETYLTLAASARGSMRYGRYRVTAVALEDELRDRRDRRRREQQAAGVRPFRYAGA